MTSKTSLPDPFVQLNSYGYNPPNVLQLLVGSDQPPGRRTPLHSLQRTKTRNDNEGRLQVRTL